MENLYGIKGIRLFAARLIEEANEFLRDHDGKIIDIKVTDEDIVFIYIADDCGEVTEA
jgi:hypothetical protein